MVRFWSKVNGLKKRHLTVFAGHAGELKMLEIAEETEKLIQLVAEKTGMTPEDIVREAIEARARAAGVVPRRSKLSRDEFIAGMRAIAESCAALPVLDARSPDEIIGYDVHGLPQ